ncbi:hypothetical protein NPX13_g2781 [Xylaria arbuscula]|uniref:Heme haloperoxidase family profile domain-containing protein n=1 Tax=Xylaria arbuscula TaxID=114810 RepID=A0A9W8NJ53_9PEZI|nr:hypothetical protein NPX13_g2781 [Xylaria arbuscula]
MWPQLRGVLLLVALVGMGTAQRPSTGSICDYYAIQRFGENSSDTQFMLMQSIVALAFGGGTTLHNAPDDSTGILNPGSFNGSAINLRPWFDGSKATTNLNNQAIGIDWLDDGAQEPLMAFLNGTTNMVELDASKNEYRLFAHFYSAFGRIYGCTLTEGFPKANDSGNPISPAYVHKFMNLNQTDLGHFIDQLIMSSEYYGFSKDDASTLSTFFNSRYNVRCAPAINGQLYSICQAPECPLAAPSPDCDAYVNVGPGENSTSSGGSSTGTGRPLATYFLNYISILDRAAYKLTLFNHSKQRSSFVVGRHRRNRDWRDGCCASCRGLMAVSSPVAEIPTTTDDRRALYWRKRPPVSILGAPPLFPMTHQLSGTHTSYTPSSAPRDSHPPHGSFVEPKQPEAELGVPTPVVPHGPPGMMHIAEMESPPHPDAGGTVPQGRFGESANTWESTASFLVVK